MAKPLYSFDAVIFDLDGVITKTALVHAQAWKAMFDEYLQLRQSRDKEPFHPFSHQRDYLPYLDGKPRYQGVRDFLASRNIHIPYGTPDDSADRETVCGLGNRKNIKFREILEQNGVEIYDSTVALIKDLKSKGIHLGVASSSKNCRFILQSAGIEELFETRVDGVISAELGLKGKPCGDIFIQAARNMGVSPKRAVVIEDAVSGVQAGKDGQFGLVIGVARENNERELKDNGADVVVRDFQGVRTEDINAWFIGKNH